MCILGNLSLVLFDMFYFLSSNYNNQCQFVSRVSLSVGLFFRMGLERILAIFSNADKFRNVGIGK